MIRARPIIFNTEMVKALLDDRKTQTRRVIKPQPDIDDNEFTEEDVNASWKEGFIPVKCPYGDVGDLLWVRETFTYNTHVHFDDVNVHFYTNGSQLICYRADGDTINNGDKWKPPLHMPCRFSRLALEITDIRVERLQDISEEDANAEGIEWDYGEESDGTEVSGYFDYLKGDSWDLSAKDSFKTLWKSIKGNESWEENPLVWVIEFKVHKQNAYKVISKKLNLGNEYLFRR